MTSIAVCLLAALIAAAPHSMGQSSAVDRDSTLRGTVRDVQGKLLAATQISLQSKQLSQPLTTLTDAQGRYSFVALSAGTYSLHTRLAGYADAGISSIFLGTSEVKNLDLTLRESTIAASQTSAPPPFFDQPSFTVSGVTDTTSLGGHGSDTVVRARESLAKEAADLGKTPPPSSESAAKAELQEKRQQIQALLVHSDTADLHHLLGDVDEKLDDPLNAVSEYQRAAELEPSEGYVFDWGSELLLHHAPEPALEVFRQGNRLFPRSARMLIGLGAASFARGADDEAIQRIGEASDLTPADPIAYQFLGRIQDAERAPPASLVERLHRFVILHPENAEANLYYAIGLWKRRDPHDQAAVTQVESLLNNALRLDPKLGAAYLQLGILHFAQGDLPQAISNYREAANANPRLTEAHYRLAQAYRKAGKAEEAKGELALYDQMMQDSAKQAERQRHEIRQFLYTLRDQSPKPVH